MKPTRILIADDHPVMREGLIRLITAYGPEWEICGTAADGAEAVLQATALRPDILILDYKMPLLHGLAVAKQIKKGLPGSEVLIYSGADSPHAVLAIYRSAVRGCLLKSEAPGELLFALQALRQHHTFRSRLITELYEKIIATHDLLETLTPREIEVLSLIGNGKPHKQIARQLFISLRTVGTHRTNMQHKLKLHSTAELAGYAFRAGLVEW